VGVAPGNFDPVYVDFAFNRSRNCPKTRAPGLESARRTRSQPGRRNSRQIDGTQFNGSDTVDAATDSLFGRPPDVSKIQITHLKPGKCIPSKIRDPRCCRKRQDAGYFGHAVCFRIAPFTAGITSFRDRQFKIKIRKLEMNRRQPASGFFVPKNSARLRSILFPVNSGIEGGPTEVCEHGVFQTCANGHASENNQQRSCAPNRQIEIRRRQIS